MNAINVNKTNSEIMALHLSSNGVFSKGVLVMSVFSLSASGGLKHNIASIQRTRYNRLHSEFIDEFISL